MADFSSLKQTIQSYIKQNGNEEITGNILQDVLLAMVSTMGDSAINALASALQDETTARQNQDGTLQGNITAEGTARQQADTALGGRIDGLQTVINGINTKLAEGYIYAGIATPSTNPGTPSGKVFYIAVQAGTYTNFGGTEVTEGITILKYNGTSWVKEQAIFTDGGVFDISAYHATGGTLAKYVDLATALDGGSNIPQSVRKGGMSIKFVQSSDNKYVQYFLTKNEWSASEADWQKMNLKEEVSQLGQKILSNSFIGKGDNYVYIDFNLITNREYIIVLKEQNWARNNTGTTSTDYVFAIISHSGGTDTSLVLYRHSTDPGIFAKTYRFTVPSASQYVRIGCRANDGVKVPFNIYDVTEIDKSIQDIGCTEHIIPVTNNTVVDRPDSVFYCRIKKGTPFSVYFEDTDNCVSQIAVLDATSYNGGGYTHIKYAIPTNQWVDIDALAFDVNYLAVYIYNTSVVATGTIKVYVHQNLKYDVQKLQDAQFIPSVVSPKTKNLYDISQDIEGKYIRSTQVEGNTIDIQSAEGCAVSGRIPVIGGHFYALSAEVFSATMYVCFTDADDKVVSVSQGVLYLYVTSNTIIHAPLGAAFVRIETKWNNTHATNLQFEENFEVTDYSAYSEARVIGYQNLPYFLQLIEPIVSKLSKPLYGKKWVVFGDSLTEKNARAKTSYYDYIKEELGLTVINKGVSGTGYMNRQDQGTAFYQRMLNVGNDFDVLTIFGSLNDMPYPATPEYPIGNWNDHNTTTICGCINQTIDNFISVAPFKKLGIITPTPWISSWDSSNELKYGEIYANALIEICSARGIPCLDLYHCSGLRPWEEAFRIEYYNEDGVQDSGVHPNSKGHKYFYPLVREFILKLFSYLDTNV